MRCLTLAVMAFFCVVGLSFEFLRADAIASYWAGTATVHDQQVPARLEQSARSEDGRIAGSCLNGSEASVASSGELHGTHITLDFN